MHEDLNAPPPAPETPDPAPASPPAAAVTVQRASLWRWIAAGLRTAFLQAPRIEATPAPWQLLALLLLPELLWFGLGRLEVKGPAQLTATVALNQLWVWGVLAWLGWWALWGRRTGLHAGWCSPTGPRSRSTYCSLA